jgi:hypothetical protein
MEKGVRIAGFRITAADLRMPKHLKKECPAERADDVDENRSHYGIQTLHATTYSTPRCNILNDEAEAGNSSTATLRQ